MSGSLLKVDGSVWVVASGGLLKVEYGLFEAGEITLGKNALGRPIEVGYATTAADAKKRLAQLGATVELAETCAELMRPTLAEAYARGGAVRKIVGLFEPRWMFETSAYDPTSRAYEGTFLDLTALAHDLGHPGAAPMLQALGLALRLVGVADDAPVELLTNDSANNLKTGERTFRRVVLDGAKDLPALLEDLANRGGGRGFRGDALPRVRIEELLAPRLPAGTKLSSFIRALDTREIPAKGPLAKAELWEIELLLDAGEVVAAGLKIDAAERAGGRAPATAYLRARHDLLARTEAPTILAQRVAALALSMSSFVELGLVTGEAWLAAADGRRAQAYARDVLETKGIDEALRERAARVLREAIALGSPSSTAIVPPPGGPSSVHPSARAPSMSPQRAPSVAPVGPHEERTLAFFGDPRAEPDLEQRRSAEPEATQRTTRKPSLAPNLGTPTGISIPPAASLPKLEPPATPEDPARRETSRPPPHAAPPFAFASERPPPKPEPAPSQRRPTNVGIGIPTAPSPSVPPPELSALARSHEATPAEGTRRSEAPSETPARRNNSVHPALGETPTPTLSGEFLRGATRPPSIDGELPPRFAKAPLFAPSDTDGAELAEHLSLPGGVAEVALSDRLPRSVLEARVQFTLLSRELGQKYRVLKNAELRADLSGIELMQAYLFERFTSRRVETPEAAREVQLHGAFLSEILSRTLSAEWTDITADKLGHWEMVVAPGTRVWPFGRVARLIAKGHKERDLVAYFLELKAKRDRR